MPRPSLSRTHSYFLRELEKLELALKGVRHNAVDLQYLIAEIILIRISQILESAISDVAYKISAGATYLDGDTPSIIVPSTTMAAARSKMLTVSREKPRQYLKWTKTKYIKDSVKHVISPQDNFLKVCDSYGQNISEIFLVRNFAAHRNADARKKYNELIQNQYWSYKGKPLGFFLISKKYVNKPNIERYLIECKVLLGELVKAQ